MKIESKLNGRVISLDDGVLSGWGEPAVATELPRRCYAAAHVVMRDGYAGVGHDIDSPGSADEIAEWIDWEPTMAQRRRLDSRGMGIAEAMDTAQRFELGWVGARELLRRTGELRLANGFVGAASSDQLQKIGSTTELVDAVAEQVAFVRSVGGVPIVLPQPWLTASGASEATFVDVYRSIIDASDGDVLLHWLGEVFHPSMRGYFPGASLRTILAHDPAKVRGLKISMLDRELEETLRLELLERDQVILTGDDYNFGPLIEGRDQAGRPVANLDERQLEAGDFSHALLGIFDVIARPAAAALRKLGAGDLEGYRTIMGPNEALGRAIFETPVQRYKAGIAFLAWLNGWQSNPMLANHEERTRATDHYVRIAELASCAGVIEDAELATERLRSWAE